MLQVLGRPLEPTQQFRHDQLEGYTWSWGLINIASLMQIGNMQSCVGSREHTCQQLAVHHVRNVR